MKICKTCEIAKGLDEFGIVKGHKGQDCHLRDCKQCRKIKRGTYYHDYYKNNPDRQARIQEYVKARRRGNVLSMLRHLDTHPCVDCGETDPVVLEFDHVRGNKKQNVASLVYSSAKWETIQAEIDKCDVRCANCHRRVTSQRAGGWYSRYVESF